MLGAEDTLRNNLAAIEVVFDATDGDKCVPVEACLFADDCFGCRVCVVRRGGVIITGGGGRSFGTSPEVEVCRDSAGDGGKTSALSKSSDTDGDSGFPGAVVAGKDDG